MRSGLRNLRWRPLRLRDVLVLSIPFLTLGAYVVGGAVQDYVNLHQFDDWWTEGKELNDLVTKRAKMALRAPRATVLEQRLDAEAADAGVVSLQIPKDVWSALQRDPQKTWGVWVDAGLGEAADAVRIRRRGDTSVHWTTGKMSFTLRTPRSTQLRGFRTLAFSVADVIPQYTALALADRFKVLAPETFVAPVFVNGRYYGMYQVTETLDEDFFGHHDLPVGPLLQGDAAERGDVFKGVPRGLFMNPYIWELETATAGHVGAETAAETLIPFLSDLSETSFAAHVRFMNQVDRNEIARFVALQLVAGDLYHMDNLHNQFWYQDPVEGLFHPVVWDLRLLDLANPPIWVNRFLRAAMRDPFLIDQAMAEVHAQLDGDRVVAAAEKLANSAYRRYRAHFDYDRLRRGVIADVGDPESAIALVRNNVRLLRDWLSDARIAANASLAGSTAILDFETRGYTGADLTALQTAAGASELANLRIFADRNQNGRLDASDPVAQTRVETAGDRSTIVFGAAQPLLPGWDTRGKGVKPGAVHYRFFLTGISERAVSTLEPILRNRMTGEPAELLAVKTGTRRMASTSWSPWQFENPKGRTTRLAGTIELRETIALTSADTLVIEPGTRVRMHPEVSIVARGPVSAVGSAARPITFEAVDPTRPWGTIALQGKGASQSRFTHVTFTGGAGAKIGRIEYSGMVDVHGARGVRFEHVRFAGQLRSDDVLHAVSAHVSLRECVFVGANVDAARLEYTEGEIRNCRFESPTGDAIDLRGSSPLIVASQVQGAGAAGIRTDERSAPLVFNSVITKTAEGIVAEDGAAPLVVHSVITGNAIGLSQAAQDRGEGIGGRTRLVRSILAGNDKDIDNDDNSAVTAFDNASPRQSTAVEQLLASFGLRVTSQKAGLITTWQEIPPVLALMQNRFVEDFGSLSDEWHGGGGVMRLEKRGYQLIASLDRKRGGIRRNLNLELTAPDGALVLLELAGRDVAAVTVTLTRDGAPPITHTVKANSLPGTSHFVALQLPAGRYRSIEIAGDPVWNGWEVDPRSGFMETRKSRLELAGLTVFGAAPRPSAAAATGAP